MGLEQPVKNDFGSIPDDVGILHLDGSYVNKARQLFHYIRQNTIQVIYSCAFETSLPVLLSWPLLMFRCTFFTGVRGRFQFPITRKIPEWFISAISCQILCNSDMIKLYVPVLFRKKCRVIYNGISPLTKPISKRQAREILQLDETKKIIGCIARLCGDKGQDILIEAFAKAFPNDEQVQLVLIGDGETRNSIQCRINELNLQTRILLKGNITNASIYLPAFDVFVLPSRTESFPNALLEAIQHGLTCVATNVGGVKEIYEKVNFGGLVEKEDIDSLAMAVIDALSYKKNSYNLNDFSLKTNLELFSNFFMQKRLCNSRKIKI